MILNNDFFKNDFKNDFLNIGFTSKTLFSVVIQTDCQKI
jgi:hypothetical protein